jgi:hypothetical protein
MVDWWQLQQVQSGGVSELHFLVHLWCSLRLVRQPGITVEVDAMAGADLPLPPAFPNRDTMETLGRILPIHRAILRRSLHGTLWVVALTVAVGSLVRCFDILAIEAGSYPLDTGATRALVEFSVVMLCLTELQLLPLYTRHRTLFSPYEYRIYPLRRWERVLLPFGLYVINLRVLLYAVPLVLHVTLLLLNGCLTVALTLIALYIAAYWNLSLLFFSVSMLLARVRRSPWPLEITFLPPLAFLLVVIALTILPGSFSCIDHFPLIGPFQTGIRSVFEREPGRVMVSVAQLVGSALAIFFIPGMTHVIRMSFRSRAARRNHPA